MNILKASFEIIDQQYNEDLKTNMLKHIELCGRTCYKSEDKITDTSYEKFVKMLIESEHGAMLEHGTVYLKISIPKKAWFKAVVDKYYSNPHSKVNNTFDDYDYHYFITTNHRILVENGWLDDLQYICEPTEYHEKRYTFRLTTSIGVTREFNRHRVNSIAEQSTRYCNYSKDKFGGEVAICIPSWLNLPEISVKYHDGVYVDTPGYSITDFENENSFLWAAAFAEKQYFELLEQDWQPQQAREVLPLCTATEIIHTAFASDWKHFFDLRYFGTTGKPHPNMIELSTLMKEEAERNNIWEELHN